MSDKLLNINEISVKKRNGGAEPFNIDKIHKMVARACEDLTGVSVSDVVMEAKLNFFDGMSSIDIHRSLTRAAAQLITEHNPNYQYVAGRLLNYDMRKTAWGGMTPPRLYDHINKMVDQGFYTRDLLDFYTEEQWDKIDDFVDHDRDLKIPHIGVSEFMTKYSMRDRSLDEITPLETPQITYILIAALVCSDTKNLKDIKTFYNHISQYNISLPTPIMAGLRSPEKQFSSCVLIETEDSLDHIYAASHAIGKYIAKRAGIGICASAIRAEGSKVRNGEIKHTGVVPFYRLFESSVKSCSQGGVRGGAATLHTMLWHLDIEDILVLKNNKGTPETRVRKLDYSIQINNYLYNRLIQGKDITLFSPNEVRDLYEAFFADQKEFTRLYEKYENDQNIRKKKISSLELFSKLMIERKDTGRIYIMNVDNSNNSSPFEEPIKMSNLCQEILLPTKPFTNILDEEGRIALCTLSAMNLGNLKSVDDLEDWMYWAVRALDNILSYQNYPLIAAQKATEDYRPLGIGTINLAYYLAKNSVKYGDPEALAMLHEIYEAMEFYGLKASVKLAKERGACKEYQKTKYAKGLLPIDWYNKNVDELTPPVYRLDWEWLREEIKLHGVRNACITAHMPAECNKWDNKIVTHEYGALDFHEICEKLGIDWQSVEFNEAPVNFDIKLDLVTSGGKESATKLMYNGVQDLIELTFEDGNTYSFTPYHYLKVKTPDGEEKWVAVCELEEGYDVVSF